MNLMYHFRFFTAAAALHLCLVLPACFGSFVSEPIPQPDGDADAEDVAEGDAAPDRDLPTDAVETDPAGDQEPEEPSCSEPCTPGQERCGAGGLDQCRDDGCGYDTVPCLLGCLDEPEPHCASLVPGNVSDPELLCAGSSDLDLPASSVDQVLLNTDDGSIAVFSDGVETVLREAGEGDVGGIVFTLQDQADADAPGLGIFSFLRFTLPTGVLAAAVGSRALVILACEDMDIGGTLSVASRSSWGLYERQTGGPGGGQGGVMTGEDGTGPGAGGGGVDDASSSPGDTGGGGGGFGGGGGRGGVINVSASVILDGGMGGSTYGNEALTPLMGGSGGGAGAYNGGEPGAPGGGGGGAVQLVSGSRITVAAGGAVDAGGGGGSGGMSVPAGQSAGGGAGSGGAVLMEAPGIVVSGSVTAAGGGAGAGGNENEEGQPGEDGFMMTGSAAGGTGLLTATSGGDGSGPSSGNGTDGEDEGISGGKNDSGGGGGGAGIVRINTLSGANLSGGRFHPAVGSALLTEGSLGLQ